MIATAIVSHLRLGAVQPRFVASASKTAVPKDRHPERRHCTNVGSLTSHLLASNNVLDRQKQHTHNTVESQLKSACAGSIPPSNAIIRGRDAQRPRDRDTDEDTETDKDSGADTDI